MTAIIVAVVLFCCCVNLAVKNYRLWEECQDLKFTNAALRQGCVYWQQKASHAGALTYSIHPLYHGTRWSTVEDLIGRTVEERQ